MDTAALKKFAQSARRSLIEQVSNRMNVVLAKDSLARRESPNAVACLEAAIQAHDRDTVVEQIAYIWFNRFSALRFMDVNHYTTVGIVSPVTGQSQPEILAEAKMGHIDPEIVPAAIRQRVQELISSKTPSANPQAEAYRLTLVAACNAWHQAMPFLFEKINDYTELLLPEDLLSEQSVLTQLRMVMTEESCQNVEIIGWLYQFYISEKKDEVFDGLKKNKKITPENIPAATQLFTPHWIVRYLVENSLGRLWMLNHPSSSLINQMDYYIQPEEPETDFLQISSPEEIRICDPACGSGHMLVYAFDLLYAIYEEEGYDAADIPAKILTQNLYGIEIDERAGELAALALTMKARSKQRNYFRQQVRPNICVLENVTFESGELKDYMNFVGRDLFTLQLQNTLHQFEEADNFGSLIRPELTDVEPMIQFLNAKNVGSDLFLNKTHLKVMRVLEQAEYLRPKYHVVVANPPYMGISNTNSRLCEWSKEMYPISKPDLFSMFIERNSNLAFKYGFIAMITMQSFMFISSFEKLRKMIISGSPFISMAHLGTKGFDSIGGEVVSTTAFILNKGKDSNSTGVFVRLTEGKSENEKENIFRNSTSSKKSNYYKFTNRSFSDIPGSPIGYWITDNFLKLYKAQNISSRFDSSNCIQPGDSEKFLRFWHEINSKDIGNRWKIVSKGGTFRKWYGNIEYVIDYKDDGRIISQHPSSILRTPSKYFHHGFVWSRIAPGKVSFRDWDKSYLVSDAGPILYCDDYNILGFLNSKIVENILYITSPTINYQVGNIGDLPLIKFENSSYLVEKLISISKDDWDNYETSFDFDRSLMIKLNAKEYKIADVVEIIFAEWSSSITEVKELEKQINKAVLDICGMLEDLTSEVDLTEITLTCNPHYRYGGNKSEAELESLLLADTMREFISYAVGCMFGRYSLDKPGLVLANQGETLADYLAQLPSPTFMPDEDNVIPILDGEWFKDDIVDRFRQFLRITFGEEHFAENLKFIEDAIGKDIRSFFLKDFYADHLKRYKKRPVYWLFSSPKGTFNALIYMHRYREDTVSIVLNKYLREFKVKLAARIEHLNRLETSTSTSKADKTRAIKEREVLKKNIDELDIWERDVIFPLALEQKSIDLDDGVKANYPKFGAALKKIPGLEAAED
jgi:type II restriction/modification system DNA methylase subunit YeeA